MNAFNNIFHVSGVCMLSSSMFLVADGKVLQPLYDFLQPILRDELEKESKIKIESNIA